MNQLNYELLELLEKNTQKSQQYFVEQKFPPHYSENTTQQNLGRQFHLLMQQLMMELPVEPFLTAYPKMAHWISQLQLIINIPSESKQYNVNLQKLIFDTFITAKYDLLIESGEKIIAVDWTSERYIQQPENLEKSWQTQLRLFLLAETQQITPDNISIIYCFVNEDDYSTIYQFGYSQEKHDAFIERLAMTLSKLPSIINSTNHSESSAENSINEHELNLQKFLKREITATEYLTTVPEVKI
ncbi:PD-(D/E)XK nuclease family protein [Fortiea contorta]|uniref:PD-(D/E)XK nuclease family protein n=1 Tax=Fortiea contorta TaxID=1892405 RepID=UPI00034DD584|nr:PD-(D/E)XK nuclease family protein [Fortiea contorta]